MKRVILAAVCLVLAGMALLGAAVPVSAANAAHMSIRSSAGTVYRGDTFTLTVSLSNDQPVSNGGIILKFDSSAFELVGGKCHVSGAILGEVSAARGGGVFVLQTDAVVSGTIFTIQMRVKDGAAFQSYSISGSPSLNISCSLSGTGVTIACRHSFENCTKVDGSTHRSTCAVCGETSTADHTWDSGTVTKAPTCKETGTKKLTCTGCGATKEETVPVSNEHSYGGWTKSDDYRHSHTCGVCGKTETVNHRWRVQTVHKQATCQETGSQTVKCADCGHTKKETTQKTDHTPGEFTYLDGENHKSACKVCTQEVVLPHDYGEDWSHDENWHMLRCRGCGHQKDQAAHIPGPEATLTTDQVCTVCARILQPMGEHVHDFGAAWVTDDTGHWHKCGGCDEKADAAPHAFEDVCDAVCDVCGMTREPAHLPAQEWSADDTGHWYDCQGCGEKVNFVPHTPGPEATTASAQLCTVCGFTLVPVLPHDHVYDTLGTLHQHICPCGEVYEAEAGDCRVCAQFPWWIVCIAVEAVAICALAVALLVVCLRKRRSV